MERRSRAAGTPLRCVALIRGINVGKAKRVAMADLRALVASLGFRDVRTLLNSGNVVFTAPASSLDDAAARIEAAMTARLKVSARVTVLTAAEVAEIVAGNPLLRVADNPSRLLVHVLARPADARRLEPLRKQDWAPEVLALGRRAAYVWCPDGVLASKLVVAVSRELDDAATARNWATIQKLDALAASSP